MKNLFLLTLIFLLIGKVSVAQVECNITITPMDTIVCSGDSVLVTSESYLLNAGQVFNFNNASIPAGWSVSGSTTFASPCTPSPDGTPYYWAASAGSATPMISSAEFDVFCGGYISFNMVYAIQSAASPCEGPDEADEGVSLQYSTDGGATWIDIVYYSPGGYELPTNPNVSTILANAGETTPYTSWNTFVVPIPAGAQTTNTSFRWIQTYSSGACCDNWGIENIVINAHGAPCGANTVVNWDNGLMDTDSFWVVPTADTTFLAFVYDTLGNYHCTSDTVFINVYPDQMTYNLEDTVYSYCPTFSPSVGVTNLANSIPPYTFDWSTPSTTNPTTLPSTGLEHDTVTYYVTIYDGCNYYREDSVVLVINQLLDIDTMYSFPASSCALDGAVSGVGQGITGFPHYEWTGPGPNNPSFINASAWANLGSGWYYFSITDDLCTTSDSVFVDMLAAPVAGITANTTSGCNPVQVVFTNTSQNATDYFFDFGNGNFLNTTELNTHTQTYSMNSTIMLIASASPCSDTTYIDISIIECGCTNPIALNYNPLAVVDDGSCIMPVPEIVAPNVFTPNNDGANDGYFIEVNNHTNVDLTIVNRWGNTMFTGSGLYPTWDGKTQSGDWAEEGTYFYTYVVTGIDGSVFEGHGFLQLVSTK